MTQLTLRRGFAAASGPISSTPVCASKSCHGTIPKGYGGVPEIGPPAHRGRTRWFTCSVRDAEGDAGLRGEAISWTAANSGWLVTGSERHTVALLAEQLVTAAPRPD